MIVYALVDPESREIRYIGETSRAGRTRLAQHLRAAAEKTTPPVNAWIRGLVRAGKSPEMVEVECAESKEGVWAAEIYWIEQFKAMGAALLNISAGGASRVGHRHSAETRQRWRETRRGENHPMFGRRRTDEQKQMFSDLTKAHWAANPHPCLGKKRPPETVEKMRLARKGRPISAEHRAALAAGSARRWEKYRAEKGLAK